MRSLSFGIGMLMVVGGFLGACNQDDLLPSPAMDHGDLQVGGITVSGPLFPRYQLFYSIEGEAYPATSVDTWAWVESQDPILSFPEMMSFCLEHEPYASEITHAENPEELTAEQLEANYRAIALCAYDLELGFRSKPYWIPRFLDEIDVCAHELGPDWSMPTESFVMAQDQTFFEEYAALHRAEGSGIDRASIYFSLSLFVRGDDGELKIATLEPGNPDPARVRPIPERVDPNYHMEIPFWDEGDDSIWNTQTVVVRCFRDDTSND